MPRGATLGSHQKRGLQTRDRLLDATIEILSEVGYAGASTPEVCKRAKLSRGAQLHHFPTKKELLAAAVERLMRRRHEELRDALRQVEPDALADTFVDVLWAIYAGDTFYAFLELAVAARTDDELRTHLVAVNERFYRDAFDTVRAFLPLPPAVEAELPALTRYVTSFMDGVAVNRILDDDDTLTDATLALFKRTIRAFLVSIIPSETQP